MVLTLAYTLSFIDRQILNLLVEPVKTDLSLSDTRISFLQGAAFVGTYVLMSVPIGRLVDRFKRVYVLIGGMLTWSAATISCGCRDPLRSYCLRGCLSAPANHR